MKLPNLKMVLSGARMFVRTFKKYTTHLSRGEKHLSSIRMNQMKICINVIKNGFLGVPSNPPIVRAGEES